FGLDDRLGFLRLGRSFELGAALGFDALGIGQSGFGHGAVLGFEHGGLGLAFAALAHFVGFGLLDEQLGLRGGDQCLGRVFAFDRLGFGTGQRNAHRLLGVLHMRVAFEAGRLLADLLIAIQLGQPHRLFALGLARADVAQLVGVGYLDHPVALGFGH